jgi:hypothetical protein
LYSRFDGKIAEYHVLATVRSIIEFKLDMSAIAFGNMEM